MLPFRVSDRFNSKRGGTMRCFESSTIKAGENKSRNFHSNQKPEFTKGLTALKRALLTGTAFAGIGLFSLARFCMAHKLKRQRTQYPQLYPDRNYKYFTDVGGGITATAPQGALRNVGL